MTSTNTAGGVKQPKMRCTECKAPCFLAKTDTETETLTLTELDAVSVTETVTVTHHFECPQCCNCFTRTATRKIAKQKAAS